MIGALPVLLQLFLLLKMISEHVLISIESTLDSVILHVGKCTAEPEPSWALRTGKFSFSLFAYPQVVNCGGGHASLVGERLHDIDIICETQGNGRDW